MCTMNTTKPRTKNLPQKEKGVNRRQICTEENDNRKRETLDEAAKQRRRGELDFTARKMKMTKT
ncbi:hypothetical protein MA16_Dca029156 [Dendrobium catenatum]|uniref:Uncharacterized protein n=1 Tax=Dendrobium catenatum TaxID=906689 RepID=A0A2I0VGR0_9ASPA|nr:hypothetical protein MA16_Dca029156 [Dendrobium catenatum]